MAKKSNTLTHLDTHGQARMVDVGEKEVTHRVAKASGMVLMSEPTRKAIKENSLAKGDVLAAARLAGIMAAKKVSELIPLTHPLPLDQVAVDFAFVKNGIAISSSVSVHARTGAEMEALAAVSVAALTIYDMAKSAEKGMTISDIKLEFKSGGKSGTWKRK